MNYMMSQHETRNRTHNETSINWSNFNFSLEVAVHKYFKDSHEFIIQWTWWMLGVFELFERIFGSDLKWN